MMGEGDEEVNLGQVLRRIRTDRGLSLSSVADLAGVSASFLSQVERGKSNAGFGTLRALCQGFDISLGDLFSNSLTQGARVMTRKEWPQIDAGRVKKYMLSRPPLRHFEVFLGEFEPGVSTGDEAYSHGDSQEMLLVLGGKLLLQVDGRDYVMQEGDVAEYSSGQLHRVENLSNATSTVLWIVSPITVDTTDLNRTDRSEGAEG